MFNVNWWDTALSGKQEEITASQRKEMAGWRAARDQNLFRVTGQLMSLKVSLDELRRLEAEVKKIDLEVMLARLPGVAVKAGRDIFDGKVKEFEEALGNADFLDETGKKELEARLEEIRSLREREEAGKVSKVEAARINKAVVREEAVLERRKEFLEKTRDRAERDSRILRVRIKRKLRCVREPTL